MRVTVGPCLDQFHGAHCGRPAGRLGLPGDRKLDEHALVGEFADPVNCEDRGLPIPAQQDLFGSRCQLKLKFFYLAITCEYNQ